MAVLLDGRKVAREIQERLKDEIETLMKNAAFRPGLRCIVVGQSPASGVYLKSQAKAAAELGIDYRLIDLEETTSAADLIAEIQSLNDDPAVHGILIQTPLPAGLDWYEVLNFVSPAKDAEGLHPENLGKLLLNKDEVAPCTAEACMALLRAHNIGLNGKEAVIVGHSNVVGKPLSLLLLQEYATTTVCHVATSKAGRLREHLARAEILIVAVGRPQMIRGEWIREGAVVLDIGINRVGDAILGDVEFDGAQRRASYITPVPGGVGPVTVMMLMKNCVALFKKALQA